MEKVKVKGSPQYRMIVVPHRPLRKLAIYTLLIALAAAAVAGSYFFALHQAAQIMLSPDQATQLRAEMAQAKAQAEELRQQVAKYEVTLQVDREASKDIREQALAQRQKIDALKRDVAVYRMMTSKNNNNPMGIGFGVFSVTADEASATYKLKLSVQKLAEGDKEFSGQLEFNIVGTRAGKEEKIPLQQVAVTEGDAPALAEKIPLQFKFFQQIETSLHLPDDFSPLRVELRIATKAKPNVTVIDGQLSWPETK